MFFFIGSALVRISIAAFIPRLSRESMESERAHLQNHTGLNLYRICHSRLLGDYGRHYR